MGYEIAVGTEFIVFVYGSLLRGECNHASLCGARYLGEAETAPAFELMDLGGFPALVAGGASAVRGEVYAVSRDTLFALDELEEHPSFYRREAVRLSDGTDVQAYVLPVTRARRYPRIASGSWRERARRV